ncbi:hypothetical protein NDU88_003231 [Pleurodeles waltl]|uniref:Uncharacterized protein n=1 Tax=Pleurodeles waltl TaxID=8319 RepID=A0AAV7RHZ4_PLEWA|nr:hypothetical protein NDU88_003231 [Pleurodeles waltl]
MDDKGIYGTSGLRYSELDEGINEVLDYEEDEKEEGEIRESAQEEVDLWLVRYDSRHRHQELVGDASLSVFQALKWYTKSRDVGAQTRQGLRATPPTMGLVTVLKAGCIVEAERKFVWSLDLWTLLVKWTDTRLELENSADT